MAENTDHINQQGAAKEDDDELDLVDAAAAIDNRQTSDKAEKRKLVNGELDNLASKSPRFDDNDEIHTALRHESTGQTQTDSVCRAPPTVPIQPVVKKTEERKDIETDSVGKTPAGLFTPATFDPPAPRAPNDALYRETREDPIDILIAKTKQLTLGEAGNQREIEKRSLSESMIKTLMKREQMRLATFETWPMRHLIDACQVAAVGFYYTGIEDCVKCAFCDGILESWVPDDVPFKEHKHFFGDACDFIQGKHTDNIPTFCLSVPEVDGFTSRYPQRNEDRSKLKGFQMRKAKYPQYSQSEARGLTFVDWPKIMPPRADLVDAGFFFTGSSDQVKCYFCGGGLKAWEETDVPWREHARHFPNCAFVTKVKGSAFIEGVKQDWEEEQRRRRNMPRPGEVIDLQRYNERNEDENLSTPMQVEQSGEGRTEIDIPRREGRTVIDNPEYERAEGDRYRFSGVNETDSISTNAEIDTPNYHREYGYDMNKYDSSTGPGRLEADAIQRTEAVVDSSSMSNGFLQTDHTQANTSTVQVDTSQAQVDASEVQVDTSQVKEDASHVQVDSSMVQANKSSKKNILGEANFLHRSNHAVSDIHTTSTDVDSEEVD